MDLRDLLAEHIVPVVPTRQETVEQALNWRAVELAYLARTFLDWDGDIDVDEIRTWLVRATAVGEVE